MSHKRIVHIFGQLLTDEKFLSETNYENRIRYVLNSYISKTDLENEFSEREQIVTESRKSVQKSNEYYDKSEIAFQNQNNSLAIENLNQCLLYAPHQAIDGTNYLSRAFEFRSKVLFRMNCLKECLHDIQQAIHLTDTQELRDLQIIYELSYRSQKENEDQSDDEESDDEESDDEESDKEQTAVEDMETADLEIDEKEFLTVNDFCSIQEKSDLGRFMQSSGEIEKEIIFVKEKAQFITLTEDSLLKYCFNCFKPINSSSFYPCVNCVDIIFCSQTCAHKACNGFHQFDCGIAGLISNYANYNLGYRALTSIGIKNIKKLNSIINPNTGPFDMKAWIDKRNHSKEEVTDDENIEQFKAFLSFVDHIDSIPIKDSISDIFAAFQIVLLIDEIKAFDIKDDEDFILLTAMMIKVYFKSCFNCFGWNNIQNETIGYCICIASAMFNHSCVPNTIWEIHNGYEIMTSKTRINSNDEMTISYGMTAESPFLERQKLLRNYYYFTCKCTLCSEQKKLYIPLKCVKCNGTVYYGNQNPSNYCVDCDENNLTDDQYFKYCIEYKLPLLKALFNQNIYVIQSAEIPLTSKFRSLSIAEGIVETVSKIFDKENEDLLPFIQQLKNAREFLHQ